MCWWIVWFEMGGGKLEACRLDEVMMEDGI